ncbi:hypothetical protein HGRIS_001300 [Hohenbuehelia grisea]|uniref:Uncharacterized protein n=1 Tax=Hohenbuehelia grisea TaxID=104357 RepID=A0ABR3JP38_9AGAR
MYKRTAIALIRHLKLQSSPQKVDFVKRYERKERVDMDQLLEFFREYIVSTGGYPRDYGPHQDADVKVRLCASANAGYLSIGESFRRTSYILAKAHTSARLAAQPLRQSVPWLGLHPRAHYHHQEYQCPIRLRSQLPYPGGPPIRQAQFWSRVLGPSRYYANAIRQDHEIEGHFPPSVEQLPE